MATAGTSEKQIVTPLRPLATIHHVESPLFHLPYSEIDRHNLTMNHEASHDGQKMTFFSGLENGTLL